MESIDISQISALSDMELVKLLTANGLQPGPITETTRMVFENLLRKRLANLTGICDKSNVEEDEQVLMGKSKSSFARLGRREGSTYGKWNTSTDSENGGFYYGVCCVGLDTSNDIYKHRQDEPLVFDSQELALEAVKNRKGSRFKAFRSRSEAESFSLSEEPLQELPVYVKDSNKPKVGSEPVSIFKAPTPREIIAFRRAIENDNVDQIQEKAFSNPKYLISSGETPVILQEGSRYNAMHVAVRSKRLSVCELIINILSEEKFWNLLFPETKETTANLLLIRKQRMIDLYLNTPDKVACETPLHMACKNGFTEIVEYLKSFSSLVTESKNAHGETPKDVICSRYGGTEKESISEQIFNILEGRSYVPVYRPEDGSSLPYIGKPVVQAIEPTTSSGKETSTGSQSPLDFNYVVKAYAGPMSPQKAGALYEQWIRSPKERDWCTVTREDFDKGLERIGRKLTKQQDIPWTEYWSFLGSFENLASEGGLQRLEQHLEDREESIRSHIIQIYSTPQRYQKSRTMRKPFSPAIARVRETDLSPSRKQLSKNTSLSRGSLSRSKEPPDDVKKQLFAEQTDGPLSVEMEGMDTREVKIDPRLKLVRQEAYCDPRDSGTARLKLGNLRSLSAGDAEIQSKHDREGISLKYSFDLEESFQNLSLDTSEPKTLGEVSPGTTKTPSRKVQQFPSRAFSDVSDIVAGINDRQCSVPQTVSPSSSPRVNYSPRSPTTTAAGSSQHTPRRSSPAVSSTTPRLTSVLTPATPIADVDKLPLPLFVEGLQPTKTDLDVLRAIESSDIDSVRFPAIWKWMHLVNSYSCENQQSWPSPGSPRYRSRVFDKSPIWSC